MEAQTNPQTIPPEEAAAIKKFAKEKDTTSLLMRIVNGTEPVRKAALKAIKELTEEKPPIQTGFRAWIARCLK